ASRTSRPAPPPAPGGGASFSVTSPRVPEVVSACRLLCRRRPRADQVACDERPFGAVVESRFGGDLIGGVADQEPQAVSLSFHGDDLEDETKRPLAVREDAAARLARVRLTIDHAVVRESDALESEHAAVDARIDPPEEAFPAARSLGFFIVLVGAHQERHGCASTVQ